MINSFSSPQRGEKDLAIPTPETLEKRCVRCRVKIRGRYSLCSICRNEIIIRNQLTYLRTGNKFYKKKY